MRLMGIGFTATFVLGIVRLLLIGGLAQAVSTDPYISRRNRRLILIIALCCFILLFRDQFSWMSEQNADILLRLTTSVAGYTIRPVIIMCFILIIYDGKLTKFLWAAVGLNAIIHMTAFFSGICFAITPDNHFARGPLGLTCAVISFLLLAFLSWESYVRYRKDRKTQMLMPMFFSLLIIAASIMDMTVWKFAEIELLPFVITTVSLFNYIWLHLQFAREHEEALKAEQRIRIMISQIQPHFLFNTLTTIQTLCDIDPPKAEETVGKFAAYLRQNIESLDRSDLVPFEKEMEHTRIYADIEMIRFPDIRVEYDTADTAFELPALTVQPLVENAIRHGVRGKEDGRVSVTSRDGGSFHEIVVADNGKGFDASQIDSMESAHVGLRNVRDRIMQLCGGTMNVISKANEGTTITIRIPKGGGLE